MYATEERKAFMDFTDWYLVEPACILMKRPKPRSGLHILILPLDEVVLLNILVKNIT